MAPEVHAMIPARIGSQRLRVKNLCLVNGRPMLSYAISAAVESRCFDKVSVNSDHPIFEGVAVKYDADFYQRDQTLGSSDTKSDEVVADYFKAHPSADILFWVNSTSPFQSAGEIRSVFEYFMDKELDSLITVERKQVHCNFNGKPINYSTSEPFAATQDLQPVHPFVYSIMAWRREPFLKQYAEKGHALFCGKFDTFPVSKLTSLIVKTSEDLMIVDYMMRLFDSDHQYTPQYDTSLAEIDV